MTSSTYREVPLRLADPQAPRPFLWESGQGVRVAWRAVIAGALALLPIPAMATVDLTAGYSLSADSSSTLTITATQPAFPPSTTGTDYTYKLGLDGILPTPPSTAPAPTVTATSPTVTTFVYTVDANGQYALQSTTKPDGKIGGVNPSIDHMPIVGLGSDPNQMDHMAQWDGADPNKMDHMCQGYDPATTKFYNSAGATPSPVITWTPNPSLTIPPPPAVKPPAPSKP